MIKKYWIIDIYVSVCNKVLLHIAVVGYIALGLLYADLNEYVSTEFRSQLESLEDKPTGRKLRKARKNLDKCLSLYKDVQSLTFMFQRIYDLMLLFSLGQSCIKVALASYSTFIILDISLPWLLSKISFEILNMLLLTLSVQRTKLQFGNIHRLVLENCHLSENKEWHRTLEVFFTHLNLYEFQVRPLGLFEISNALLVNFLSALITYLTVVIQYGMQLDIISLTN
ncbi:putative gustatory receptor 93b [Drosophila serrata]|uniref:putative gustatory receptor 93b n=1 Tax=Drosophila serrata TaxID=7274 RepID=UPI000A1D2771|nr:putative gustatory receptor 93b [Drosophila serrata]